MSTDDKMLQPERLLKIQQLLERDRTVKVSHLSIDLGVSENTIRRDLMELEDAGFCYRTKGGAGFLEHDAPGIVFSRRLNSHRFEKRAMAEAASAMLRSGDTVILDSGTTLYELALKLREKEHLTVITPSLEAAQVLVGLPKLTLILSGGIVQNTSRSMTGSPAEAFFETVHADYLFLAVKGISITGGLTDHTMAEASVKRKMIRCAGKVVVLADHSKLEQTALSRIAGLDVVNRLITDSTDELELFRVLENSGTEIIITGAGR